MPDEAMKRMSEYSGGPAWGAFGMSRANYFVMPRRALCSMPEDWQKKFVDLVDELRETIDMEGEASGYSVNARDAQGRFTKDELAAYRHVRPMPLLKKSKALHKCPISKPQLRTLSAIYIEWVLHGKDWINTKNLKKAHPASVTALIAGGYLKSDLTEDDFGAFLIVVKPTPKGVALVEKYG